MVKGGKWTMSVRVFPYKLDAQLMVLDFLAVRKIPLTRYPYLDRNLEGADDSVDTDPAALELQSYIRKIVLTDRDLADKVSPPSHASLDQSDMP